MDRGAFDIRSYLEEQRSRVDHHLDRFLPDEKVPPRILHQAMRYSVFAGGKRIRPALALATGEALGGDFDSLIHLACALEMIHTYSLIHDDLPAMDDDDYRRGQLTCHKKFGEAIAILAGNALFTMALQILTRMPTPSAEDKVGVIGSVCAAAGTTAGMLAGQVLDLESEGKPASPELLESIHSSKTGALIRAAICCAARLSGASPRDRERLGAFGRALGLAFQIVDDVLDVEGSPEELGKTSGKDDLSRKATYPSLYGIEESRRIADGLAAGALSEIEFLGERGRVLRQLARFIVSRSH